MNRKHTVAAIAMAGMMAMGAGCAYFASPTGNMKNYESHRLKEGRDKYFASPEYRKALGGGAVMVTFLGTTTLLFDDGQTQLLIDGFLTRPRLIPSALVRTKSGVVDGVLGKAGVDPQKLKAVFVSHSHYDHAMDVAYIVNQYPSAVLYGSSSTHYIGSGARIPAARNIEFQVNTPIGVGGPATPGEDHFVVTVLDSKHSPNPLFPGPIKSDLSQPAWIWQYKEGGSYDFMIRHGTHTILVRAGANVPDPHEGRDDKEAEVLFLGTGGIGKEKNDHLLEQYFNDTVARLRPPLVIPLHWDDFYAPLTSDLQLPMRIIDRPAHVLDYLVEHIDMLNGSPQEGRPPVEFRILQGYESIILFRSK